MPEALDSGIPVTGSMRSFAEVVIVGRDCVVTGRVAEACAAMGSQRVERALSVEDGLRAISRTTELIVCQTRVEDGTCVDLARGLRRAVPAPLFVVLVAAADREMAVDLVRAGVDAILDDTAATSEIQRRLAMLLDHAAQFERAAVVQLGRLTLKQAQETVRRSMFKRAMEITQGNRHAAARLLGVDRRYVIMMADKYREARDDSDAAPPNPVRPFREGQ